MEKVRKYCNYIGIVGCVLLLLGNFFTFVTVSVFGMSKSVKFVDGDGIFVIVAAIIAIIFIFMKKGRWNYAPAIISAAVAIYDVADAKDAVSSVGSLVKVDYGIGFFMIMLGAIAVAAYAFLYKNDDKNILPLTKDALIKKK